MARKAARTAASIVKSAKVSQGILPLTSQELQLAPVLLNGQTFRWIRQDNDGSSFIGTAHGRMWKLKRIDGDAVEWKVVARATETRKEDDERILREYLQVHVNMSDLYSKWSEADEKMAKLLQDDILKGVRILQQEPLECLFSFICSANNNIKRISKMVNRLGELYGKKMSEVEDKDIFQEITVSYPFLLHAFPSLDEFSVQGMEDQLRKDGFGYRAAYVKDTVSLLRDKGGETSLNELRGKDIDEGRSFLTSLTGIGPKVADCILLMSLGHSSLVPLDVHMWRTTRNLFMPSLPEKPALGRYGEIGRMYVEKFGEHAGWAQAVLFNAQLMKNGDERKNQKRKSDTEDKERKKKVK